MSDATPQQSSQPQSGAVPPPPPPAPQGLPSYAAGPGSYGSQYPATPTNAPYSVAVLILGIVGLLISICAPIAMILGFVGRKKVKEAPAGTYNTGMLTAGWILGIVGTVLLVLSIVFFLFVGAIVSDPSTDLSGALISFF